MPNSTPHDRERARLTRRSIAPPSEQERSLRPRDGNVLTSIVAATVHYAKSHGIELEEIAREAQIELSQLLDRDARLSDDTPIVLWNLIRQRAGDGPYGLHMASATPASAFGPWLYPLRFAPSLQAVLDSMIRWRAVIANRLKLELEQHGAETRMRSSHPNDPTDEWTMSEFGIAMAFRILSEELGFQDAISRVELGGGDRGHPETFEAFFKVEVRHNCSSSGLIFESGSLDLPTREYDPSLFRYAQGHLEALEERWQLQSKPDPIAPIRRAVDASVESGQTQVHDVATRLRVGTRSLQRQVRAHGLTVTQLIDDAREVRARGLLLQHQMDTAEIARRLGYSDDRSFRRAFRRWTGLSPREFRRD